MSAFEMLAFFRFIKFYNEGEITMVSVRKRGKVYEYRFEIATVEGTRKWITKSGYPTKAEAFKEGAKAYNDFYYNGQKTQLRENMSYADFLDYWIDNYASFNLHYSTTNIYVRVTNKMESDTVDRFEKYTTTLDIPQTAEIPYQV